MSSKISADGVDFARDVKTTAADVRALRAARTAPIAVGYLEFLESFPEPTTLDLRHRQGPRGEPFRLLESTRNHAEGSGR